MTKKTTLLLILTTFIFLTTGHAQTAKPANEYLNVPGPVVFENKSYLLIWSSNPVANFYKQEYLVKGDTAGKYKTMLMIDVMVSNKNIKDVVAEKIAELKKMKLTNPVVNYETFDNAASGEYLLDFILSANTPDGKYISTVERNVYRYKTFTDKSGKKSIMLFGISIRAYGNDIDKFFATLKSNKKELVNQVAAYKLPEINIVQ